MRQLLDTAAETRAVMTQMLERLDKPLGVRVMDSLGLTYVPATDAGLLVAMVVSPGDALPVQVTGVAPSVVMTTLVEGVNPDARFPVVATPELPVAISSIDPNAYINAKLHTLSIGATPSWGPVAGHKPGTVDWKNTAGAQSWTNNQGSQVMMGMPTFYRADTNNLNVSMAPGGNDTRAPATYRPLGDMA